MITGIALLSTLCVSTVVVLLKTRSMIDPNQILKNFYNSLVKGVRDFVVALLFNIMQYAKVAFLLFLKLLLRMIPMFMDKIREVFQKLIGNVTGAGEKVVGEVRGAGKKVVTKLGNAGIEGARQMGGAVVGAGNEVANLGERVIGQVDGAAADAANRVGNYVRDLLNKAGESMMDGLMQGLDAIENVTNMVGANAAAAAGATAAAAGAAANAAAGAGRAAANAAADAGRAAISYFTKYFRYPCGMSWRGPKFCTIGRSAKRVDAGKMAEKGRQEAIAAQKRAEAAQKRAEAAQANRRIQDVARIRADIGKLVTQIKNTSGMTTSREQQLKVKDLYTQLNSKKNELVKLQNTPIYAPTRPSKVVCGGGGCRRSRRRIRCAAPVCRTTFT
jgi:hypothetical protein